MPSLRRKITRFLGYTVFWIAGMAFLWAPWNAVAVGHGKGYHETLYGILGYYVIHHPGVGPVTSRVDRYMLVCTAVLTLALTAGCLDDALKTPPLCVKCEPIDLE